MTGILRDTRAERLLTPFMSPERSRRVIRFLLIAFVVSFCALTLIVATDKLNPWLPRTAHDILQAAWVVLVGLAISPLVVWWANRRRHGQ